MSLSSRLGQSVVLVVLAVSGATPCVAGGGGDLLVAPTRVVLEGTTRSESVTLRNTGLTPALYRVSLEHYRMSEAGVTELVTDPDAADLLADSLVRFSPKQVLLQPGATQVVRLLVRKPADLAAGEYRSHLAFRAVPQTTSVEDEAPAVGWSLRLDAIFGVSIPVIVRHGKTASSVTVSAARLVPAEQGRPASVEVDLDREGNRSSYGDVTIADAGGSRVVGRARGVAVWLPNATRRLGVPLDPTTPLPPGPLVATYTARDTGEVCRAPVER